MYVDSKGCEIYTPQESARMLYHWRGQRNTMVEYITLSAAEAEQRGWPVYAAKFLDLAMRVEATPLNELFYHMFNQAPEFSKEHVRLLKEWDKERRESGVSLI